MRILLTANASYVPPRGGATRSNLIWMDHLAGAGHACRFVCGTAGDGAELRFHDSLAVFAVDEPARRIHVLRQQIAEFRPDWVLVSSEDLGHGLLREAQHSAAGRVVYLAHTPQFFPFGEAAVIGKLDALDAGLRKLRKKRSKPSRHLDVWRDLQILFVRQRRQVDGILHDAELQVFAHLQRNLHADGLLRFGSRSGNVRRENHIFKIEK